MKKSILLAIGILVAGIVTYAIPNDLSKIDKKDKHGVIHLIVSTGTVNITGCDLTVYHSYTGDYVTCSTLMPSQHMATINENKAYKSRRYAFKERYKNCQFLSKSHLSRFYRLGIIDNYVVEIADLNQCLKN